MSVSLLIDIFTPVIGVIIPYLEKLQIDILQKSYSHFSWAPFATFAGLLVIIPLR